MAPPKDIARSYPKRGLTADVGFRSDPKFCGDGSTEFDGSADFVNASNYTKGSSTATAVSFWMKSEKDLNNSITVCNNQGGGSNSVDQFIVRSFSNSLDVQFDDGSQRSVNLTTTAAGNFSTHAWHHVLFVIDGSSATFTCKAFFDGIKQDTITSGGYTTGTGLNIGARASSFYFDGKIADFRIYDVVLTDAQCLEIYNDPSNPLPSGISSSNLRRRYLLATDFNDTGADSQNGTATGSPSFTVDRPQLPRGLDLARGAAMARVYTGRGVQFDGSADHLDAAVYSNSSDYFSVSVWINPDAIGANRNIVTSGDTGDNAFLVFLNSSGKISFYGNDTGGDYAITHQTTLEAGRWYHLAMSVDQSDAANNTIKAYIDGVENTTSKSAAGWIGNSSALEIAARNSATFFDGSIAGVKVFNSQLTAAQIRELYHNPEQVLPTGVSASNLRRYYPLSDYNDTGGTGGRYFQDMGADGEPAEDQGSALMAFAQPVPCPQLGLQQSASRVYFDGSGGGSTGPRWDASLSAAPGATWAVAYWIWMDSSVSSYSFIFEASGFQHYILTGGDLKWSNGLQTTFTSAFPSSKQDKWSHVVMTSTGSSPYVKCYVDGVEQTTTTGASDAKGFDKTAFTVLARPTTTTGFHKGFCANMAIFDDALSSAEVTELFNQGIGYDLRNDTGDYASSADLLNYWLFDDLTSVVDRKGSNNLTNSTSTAFLEMASFPENASGSTIVGDFSMKRKGASVLNFFSDPSTINSRAVIPAQESIFPTYPDGYTFSAFFRLIKRGTGAFSTIFYSTDTSVANQLGAYANASGIFQFEAGDGGTSSTRIRIVATTAITDSEWHHLAATITHGTPSTAKIYIDGALDVTDTSVTQTGEPTPSDVVIGDYPTGTNEARGPIACFRAYQVPLSDNEIKQIYNSDLRLIKGLENE